jgi:glutamyl/glutaminyl-tRNA synthetase
MNLIIIIFGLKFNLMEKKMTNRKFISIYLPYINENGEKTKKNFSIPFNINKEEVFYKVVKQISSTEIKKIISIFSYNQLIKLSEKENRKKVDILKIRLKENLIDKSKIINRNISIKPKKIKTWVKSLEKLNKTKNYKYIQEIITFFNEII